MAPAPGEWWWVPDAEQCFIPAKVESAGASVTLKGEDGATLTCDAKKLTVKIDAPEYLDSQPGQSQSAAASSVTVEHAVVARGRHWL